MAEDELTLARRAQIEAEEKVLALESLVETLERQRDYADGLLLNLLAKSQDYFLGKDCPAYVNARRYICRVATLDKFERRLM